MRQRFPTAEAYSAEQARHAPLAVIDVQDLQRAVDVSYRNDVLCNVNDDCLRLAVFDHLMDIGRIGELSGVRVSGDTVTVGAGTTQSTRNCSRVSEDAVGSSSAT